MFDVGDTALGYVSLEFSWCYDKGMGVYDCGIRRLEAFKR